MAYRFGVFRWPNGLKMDEMWHLSEINTWKMVQVLIVQHYGRSHKTHHLSSMSMAFSIAAQVKTSGVTKCWDKVERIIHMDQ